jgi:hypothetical protein
MKKMGCRTARRGVRLGAEARTVRERAAVEREAIEHHIAGCSRCATEFRVFNLGKTVLDSMASDETIVPDDEFFVALRARIARGPQTSPESSATLMWVTARQLIPAMAMLLMLILGATLLWGTSNGQRSAQQNAWIPPSDRLLLNEVYEYPAPTTDDVIETLVAVEENTNGK